LNAVLDIMFQPVFSVFLFIYRIIELKSPCQYQA